MKRYIALLLAIVILLTACGTHHSNSGEPSDATENTVLDNQNGTADTTNETTATTDGSGETNSAEATGSSGTDTTETAPPTDAPTVPSVTPTTTPTTESTVPADYTLKISQNELSLEVGQIGNLTVDYTGTGTIVWKSSNESVATVSNGKVTAKSAGSVVITVTDGVKSSQCVVTVNKKTVPVEVTLNLSKSSLDLKVGESATLSVSYTGTKSLTWTSSNTDVATVSKGKITAKSAGTTVVTVSDGSKNAQCIVNVTNASAPVEVKLSVSPTSLNLVVGNTSTLTASYNGTGTLSWKTSDTSVATVSNGKVTAKAAGNATITVTDGNKSATCKVKVTAPVTQTLEIKTADDTMVFIGETLQIDYTYSGKKSELTWSSSDDSCLSVNNNGVVTGKATGSYVIQVTNGSIKSRVMIVVESQANKTTSIYDFDHNAPLYDGVTKFVGDYMNFEAVPRPEESNHNLIVTSSNTNVVSVSYKLDYCSVTQVALNFVGAGSAIVTITSGDGAVSKSYTINVKADYDCNPGSGQLDPETWAECATQVMVANGFMKETSCGSYRVLTLSADELTFVKAKTIGQACIKDWYPNGCRYCWISYEGVNEDGKHVFYTRWG